jgi:hypothetical protein
VVVGSGALTGAEVAGVVGVAAVGDGGEAELRAELLHGGEELVLAVEAALAVVAEVVGAGHLLGLQDVERDAVGFGEGDGGGELFAGQAGGVGQDGKHVLAEDLVGFVGEIGGVHAAGVGDEEALMPAKVFVEGLLCGRHGISSRQGVSKELLRSSSLDEGCFVQR